MAVTSANPALSTDAFDTSRLDAYPSRWGGGGTKLASAANTMTLEGTVGKSLILLFLVLASAMWTWRLYLQTQGSGAVFPWMLGGLFGGFVVAVVTMFKKKAAPITAPLYAVLEGLALGGLSAVFNSHYPGIVIQAVGLTIGTCAAMLLAYASHLIRPTAKFMIGVAAATGGIMIFYLITMVLGFFHIHVPFLFASGPIGIAFSVFIVIIAALNLIIDFEVIRQGTVTGAPKYMEWYGGFALMVTLIWLYMEILRLLAKTRSRD